MTANALPLKGVLQQDTLFDDPAQDTPPKETQTSQHACQRIYRFLDNPAVHAGAHTFSSTPKGLSMNVKPNAQGVTTVEITETKEHVYKIRTYGRVNDNYTLLKERDVKGPGLAFHFEDMTGLRTKPKGT
jgi:hypothetical protein